MQWGEKSSFKQKISARVNQDQKLIRRICHLKALWMKNIFWNLKANRSLVMFKEKNQLITEEKDLATVMNTFFVNITEVLDKNKDNDSSLKIPLTTRI